VGDLRDAGNSGMRKALGKLAEKGTMVELAEMDYLYVMTRVEQMKPEDDYHVHDEGEGHSFLDDEDEGVAKMRGKTMASVAETSERRVAVTAITGLKTNQNI